MKRFTYHVPTEIRFGRDQFECLEKEIGKYGKKILLVHGDGSIKKNGLFDRIRKVLKDFEIRDLGGVTPNPKLSAVKEGVSICKKEGIEAVLAVGGGSVIDTAKLVACAANYDGDPWELITDPSKVTKALPIFTVRTTLATGSEMNSVAVICNEETKEKLELDHPLLYPKLSICDPSCLSTLSKEQMASGIVDIFTQILELNFQAEEGGCVMEQQSETALKTLIKYGPAVLAEPENYEAGYALMWTGSFALSQLSALGRGGICSVSPMARELSIHYDTPHGIGMSLLMIEWMRFVLTEETQEKFAKYARLIWNVQYDDDHTAARVGIDRMEEFFRKLGMPRMLSDFDVDDSHFAEMASEAVRIADLENKAYVSLSASDVEQIYRNCW